MTATCVIAEVYMVSCWNHRESPQPKLEILPTTAGRLQPNHRPNRATLSRAIVRRGSRNSNDTCRERIHVGQHGRVWPLCSCTAFPGPASSRSPPNTEARGNSSNGFSYPSLSVHATIHRSPLPGMANLPLSRASPH